MESCQRIHETSLIKHIKGHFFEPQKSTVVSKVDLNTHVAHSNTIHRKSTNFQLTAWRFTIIRNRDRIKAIKIEKGVLKSLKI